MADERLELFIETLTGTAFELQVSPLETVMSIKAKIQHLEGIPVSQQHLIWRSKELDNEFSLQDYCIQDGSTLKLVLGMRGGPINTRKGLDYKNPMYTMAELFESERLGFVITTTPRSSFYSSTNNLTRNRGAENLADIWEGGLQDILDGRPLTVVLLHDGDKVHWYTVIEEDGSPSASRCPSCDSEPESVEREPSAGRQLENQVMAQKVALLQRRLKSMGIGKKTRKKKFQASPTPSLLNRASPLEHSFLPPISQATFGRLKKPIFSGTPSNKNSPMPTERLPSISSASSLGIRTKSGRGNSGSKKTRFGGLEFQIGASNHSATIRSPTESRQCCCCCNGCLCGRKASFGGTVVRRISSVTSPSTIREELPNVKDSESCCKTQALTAIKIKDMYRFSSVAGTPTTSYRNLSELDEWIDNRPKTTPSKTDEIYHPLDSIAPSQISKMNQNHLHHHHHYHPKNYILGKSVHEVGCRNQKLTRITSPGAIVSAGLNGLRNSKRSTNKKSEFASQMGVKLEEVERIDSASKLPPIKVKKKSKRCTWCNKKTGLATSYNCRCGKNFCATHRYPEVHHCSHDFKTEGRRLLQLSNPVINAPKLPKI